MDGDLFGGIERELIINNAARNNYRYYEALFSTSRKDGFGDLHDARVLAWRMNERRDLIRFPELSARAGHLFVIGLMGKIMRLVMRLYQRQVDPSSFEEAGDRLRDMHGKEKLSWDLLSFMWAFPPAALYRDGLDPEEYIGRLGAGEPLPVELSEEIILLSLSNLNPAYRNYKELFDDSILRKGGTYPLMFDFFAGFFRSRPPFGPEGLSLIDMLRQPALASPDSLGGQLEYMMNRWGRLVSPYLTEILTCLDFLREEEKPAFAAFGGPGPVLEFLAAEEGEEERYSPDRDWMSGVVLIAKSVFVWLHQMSVKYGRDIHRLDQIPDEELDILAGWGFTGLWLIGVWERSPASREIKRLCGNPEAESSAYSLYDYTVADELGGVEALKNLKERAGRRGIRLAADMVPNHVGIYSKWVIEHPEWFIQQDHPPFPSYRYSDPDLSRDPSVSIYIEDGYWSRSDAAVAFKRVDKRTGEVRYIYHGNDGTGLPWNDTAQLDYLRKEVREAVIGTILHVASIFPIIRFDAAMTLTRRHFQRLWFPEPGSGGDIPSRSGRGLSNAEFKRLLPVEFWREVVDRVAAEVPDTLLLAEAFWLMEGYFVRTLGMHRVYNSAFMNMLKREDNAKYRQTIKNVLEYDPEILKRFVNFMNNPDEETAVAQFGKGDKYFGTAVMMVTMPGLPMFGHGQVEGFTEKYGMEYRRSYHDEFPDEELVRRHEREIFPLMRKRHLFSGADNFTLYDFYMPEGRVDENVFAYSNRSGGESCLVIYNNAYRNTAGWIREAAAVLEKTPGGRRLVRRNIGEELGLISDPRAFCIFRDFAHGLEYIRPCQEIIERGLEVLLGAYQYNVFIDFRQVRDEGGEWAELNRFLGGRGVSSLQAALRDLVLAPLHRSFRDFFNPEDMRDFVCELGSIKPVPTPGEKDAVGRWEKKLSLFLDCCRDSVPGGNVPEGMAGRILEDVGAAARITGRIFSAPGKPPEGPPSERVPAGLEIWRLVLAYTALRRLGEIAGRGPDPERSVALFEELLLTREVLRTFRELGCGEEEASVELLLLKILIHHQERQMGPDALKIDTAQAMESFLRDPDVQKFLGFNRYHDRIWFVKERFEKLVGWMLLGACIEILTDDASDEEERSIRTAQVSMEAQRLIGAASESGYMVDRLIGIGEGPDEN